MEVQDFALETFMGATEEAAEHAEQEDMFNWADGPAGSVRSLKSRGQDGQTTFPEDGR